MSQASKAFLTLTLILCVLCFERVAPLTINEQQPDGDVNDLTDKVNEVGDRLQSIRSNLTIPEMWKVPDDLALDARSASEEPGDCADLYDAGTRTSGVYTIYVGRKKRPLSVYCDMTTNGGGWTVFQKRSDGLLSFYLGWSYYTNGFGYVTGEHWLGNLNIHLLTLKKKYTLRVDLTDFSGNTRYAEYSDFKVGSACENFKLLSVGTYCGNAGDSLTYHVGCQFSTLDQDYDFASGSCAQKYKGAWWFNNCHHSDLNGVYGMGSQSTADGVMWYHWLGYNYSLKKAEMKIRPADFNL